MVAARKQMAASANVNGNTSSSSEGKTKNNDVVEKGAGGDPSKRPLSNYNYDEAVLKVQEWNEALKCKRYIGSLCWFSHLQKCSPLSPLYETTFAAQTW